MPSRSHDQLVADAVAEMQRQGCTQISASLSNYTKPALINGYIPDATGVHSNRIIIVEAETADGLNQAHTNSQLRAFHSSATRRNGTLILVVDSADKLAAEKLLQQLLGTQNNALVWLF